MKKTLVAAVIILVVGASLSFALARWAGRHRSPVTAANLQDLGWLRHKLNLDESQSRAIGQLEAGFRAKLDTCCAAHCAARIALGDELANPKPNPEKARACVDRMNTAQADSERATLAHILEVRALLNETQARQYSALVRNQVCNMPMGAP